MLRIQPAMLFFVAIDDEDTKLSSRVLDRLFFSVREENDSETIAASFRTAAWVSGASSMPNTFGSTDNASACPRCLLRG
jgi:hypothetical protein